MNRSEDAALLGVETVLAPDGESHFVVVLGADSAARFDDEPIPLLVRDFATTVGQVSLIFRTRYSEEGFDAAVPRELRTQFPPPEAERGTTTVASDSVVILRQTWKTTSEG